MSRKTKIAFANEGAEKAKLEEEIANRKRKAEEKVKWEGKSDTPFIPLLRRGNPFGVFLRSAYRCNENETSAAADVDVFSRFFSFPVFLRE